jgi:hypothetical protein
MTRPEILKLIFALIICVDSAGAGGGQQSTPNDNGGIGQQSCVFLSPPVADTKATGNMKVDFVGVPGLSDAAFLQEADTAMQSGHRKSPWLAAGLSIVLPGAGEWYAESYWKSAAFLAVEVALWTVAYIYDHKGDTQTDFFQNYANQHWSVVRYAQYALDHLAPAGGNYTVFIPNTGGLPPWKQVNWAELNRMERDIGGYYSHVLPSYGEQQYFELIGKYPQFNQGWDDAAPAFTYGDPLTPEFLYYADERGKANRFYDKASTMVTIVIVNHIVSAIDGALTAHSFNSSLHASVGTRTVPTEIGWKTVPVVTLRYDL